MFQTLDNWRCIVRNILIALFLSVCVGMGFYAAGCAQPGVLIDKSTGAETIVGDLTPEGDVKLPNGERLSIIGGTMTFEGQETYLSPKSGTVTIPAGAIIDLPGGKYSYRAPSPGLLDRAAKWVSGVDPTKISGNTVLTGLMALVIGIAGMYVRAKQNDAAHDDQVVNVGGPGLVEAVNKSPSASPKLKARIRKAADRKNVALVAPPAAPKA
jgi:hypothetical protein